jgi:D-glycerate 3-kinase
MTVEPRIFKLFASWVAMHSTSGRIPLLGISGAQGSGKSTLAQGLAAVLGGVHFSLDDVYATKAQRNDLARLVHPLFASRGLPLTHDLGLALETMAALRAANHDTKTSLPAFDKISDDRIKPALWPQYVGRPRVIIVDGWCLGAKALSSGDIATPINDFERDFDAKGKWRRHWNEALAGGYKAFFARFDAVLYLKAPTFDVVLDWRCEQEETLLGLTKGTLPVSRREQLSDFVASFERLTRHMLGGGVTCDSVVMLDKNRRVKDLVEPIGT